MRLVWRSGWWWVLRVAGLIAVVGATGAVVSLPAQKPVDLPATGAPGSVFLGISENTNVSYTGPVPGPIVGALDVDDSTYNRLIGACGAPSGTGTAVSYDTITINNNSGAMANFVVGTSAVGDTSSCVLGDTYLFAYSPTFDPANPAANCVTGDDDGGVPPLCSRITFPMAAGQTTVVVVTSFGNDDLFAYQVNFDGTVAAVPFSGPVWLMILALVLSAMGIWLVRRRPVPPDVPGTV